MRTRTTATIAPDFPERATWVHDGTVAIDHALVAGPVLVEFWDFARVNSLRTLPYTQAWHDRYSQHGLTVVGVHASAFEFARPAAAVSDAVERLAVTYPVLVDDDFACWRVYGNRGWPARYLWTRGGTLMYWHYGEGDYLDAEVAIQEALESYGVSAADMPEPMRPQRPEDAPGVTPATRSADIELPRDAGRVAEVGEWSRRSDHLEATAPDAALVVECVAVGEAYAVRSGPGVEYAGCHLIGEPLDGVVEIVAGATGARIHSIQFTPRPDGIEPTA